MFKAAVFTLVMTLVGGPTATVLCGSWCDRGLMPETHHHDAVTPAVAAMSATDACSGADLWAGPWREETRRVAPGHERDLQLPGSVAQLVRPECSLRSRDPAWIAAPPERRPFSTQLRI
jgi:hypothetical protein